MMTEKNNELRGILKNVECIANQCLHSQPNDDDACEIHLMRALSNIASAVSGYRKMAEIEAYEIEYDTDGKDVDLPKSMRFMVNLLDIDEDEIADLISDKTGWLVKTFQWRVL